MAIAAFLVTLVSRGATVYYRISIHTKLVVDKPYKALIDVSVHVYMDRYPWAHGATWTAGLQWHSRVNRAAGRHWTARSVAHALAQLN
jgi:hypothetical protein